MSSTFTTSCANTRRPYSLAVLAVAAASLLCFIPRTAAALTDPPPPFASIAFSRAPLISGGLDGCLSSVNASTCSGGLASAMAVFRNTTKALGVDPDNTAVFGRLDTDSSFVGMHPDEYGVNVQAYRMVGVKHIVQGKYAFVNIQRRRNYEAIFTDDVRFLNSNIQVSKDDEWYGYVDREAILFNNTVGVIYVDSVMDIPSSRIILSATKYLRTKRSVKIVVVVNYDSSLPAMQLFNEIQSNKPDVFYDLTGGVATGCNAVNGTQLCSAPYSASSLAMLHLHMRDGVFEKAVLDITPVTGLRPGDAALDATYYEHQALLKIETQKAIAFDPVLATTDVPMPVAQSEGYYACYKDECGQSTLYGRAMLHYAPQADFAITNGGGDRGAGWPAGEIRLSKIWEMRPFSDPLMSLQMTGYKVYELFNLSMYHYTGVTTLSSFANRFLQGAGFKIEYDATKAPRTPGRLLSIRIRDHATGEYVPLVRTKHYTLVTDDYMYKWMSDVGPILRKPYRGEVVTNPLGSGTIQNVIADYLRYASPYNNILSGSIIPVTADAIGSRVPMVWEQTAATCKPTEFWDEGIVTCMACPQGQMRSAADASKCQPIIEPESKTSIVPIIVPIVVVLVVLVAVAFGIIEYHRRKSTRNTSAAPKTGDRVTIIFTDIESSTKLWGTVPASMAAALETHHRVIRECISQFGAYEVKTIGDSFMIACDDVDDAAMMTVRIQEALAEEEWPACISQVYAAYQTVNADTNANTNALNNDLLDLVSDEPTTTIKGDFGVRVRIGLNTGSAEAVFDEVSKGYDYYGPAVNLASRLEGAGQGGQIICSRAVANLLQPNEAAFTVGHFANVALNGISGLTELLQINPKGLASRNKYSVRNIRQKGLDPFASYASAGTSNNGVGDKSSTRSSKSNGDTPKSTSTGANTTGFESNPQVVLIRETLDVTLGLLEQAKYRQVIDMLATSWRVATNNGSSSSRKELLQQIGMRASHVLKRRLRTIVRQQLKANADGGNAKQVETMSEDNFDINPVAVFASDVIGGDACDSKKARGSNARGDSSYEKDGVDSSRRSQSHDSIVSARQTGHPNAANAYVVMGELDD